jgi:cardiolipin synthase
VLASAPTLTSPTRPLLNELLRSARRSIEVIMAYFAPDDELIETFCAAADRGVHVRLILPARSDLGIMVVAAHSFYSKLLAHGVEIFERQNAVLHAKTLVIDGRITIIGSANLDYRSVESNLEISALITSEPFAADVRRMLDHDVRFSREIKRDEWRRRPWRDRFIQWVVSRLRYLL